MPVMRTIERMMFGAGIAFTFIAHIVVNQIAFRLGRFVMPNGNRRCVMPTFRH
jgi:hypothetical protein